MLVSVKICLRRQDGVLALNIMSVSFPASITPVGIYVSEIDRTCTSVPSKLSVRAIDMPFCRISLCSICKPMSYNKLHRTICRTRRV